MLQSINLYNQLVKNKLFSKSVNFNLDRIKLVLKKLNHPEKKLKNVINIIGSDGKYSLLTALKYFIEANKQKTSAYISPSLVDIKERFWNTPPQPAEAAETRPWAAARTLRPHAPGARMTVVTPTPSN